MALDRDMMWRMHTSLRLLFLSVVTLLLSAAQVIASSGKVSAELKPGTLHAGEQAIISVVLEIAPGLHAQSHTPLDENLIPLTVKMDPNQAVAFGDVEYPPAEIKEFPIGRTSAYTGQVILHVPLTVKSDAPLGAVRLSGRIHYQACNDTACFQPETQQFEIKTSIVGATETGQAPPLVVSGSITTPNPPSATAGTPASVTPQIFGRDLTADAYPLAFFAAFLVGIIFNAMPCVLPVVPLKIMGFYEVSQHNRGKSIALGAVFSAGLIASFAVLAVLVVALRVLDWGGLFQKTWFTLTIVSVLTVMAFSLFGFFSVNLPTGIYSFTPRHDTYTGNFLFGVLTAALSTPCTFGMFVGLLAWALKQPASIGVALIMTVGAGMAFPYFVLSAFPQAARNFPRTGPWAEVIKQLMGFLLLATAVYFAQPLFERFVSDQAFWWTLFGVIAAGGIFLVARSMQLSRTLWPRVIAGIIAVLIVAPSLWAARQLTIRPFDWQPYSDQMLAESKSAGRPVLVDFTATWCGNCHYVEAFVLHDPKIIAAVRSKHVLMVKADVTDENAPARPLLGQLNPAGAIPLTAIYFPGKPEPKLLTGIYSVQDLLNELSND